MQASVRGHAVRVDLRRKHEHATTIQQLVRGQRTRARVVRHWAEQTRAVPKDALHSSRPGFEWMVRRMPLTGREIQLRKAVSYDRTQRSTRARVQEPQATSIPQHRFHPSIGLVQTSFAYASPDEMPLQAISLERRVRSARISLPSAYPPAYPPADVAVIANRNDGQPQS